MTETWNLPNGPLSLSGPFFIGILNVTPDSFSDGGQFLDPPSALRQAHRLAAAGAGMLDLGAESTRPGASPVSEKEEWARLEPVLTLLREQLPATPLCLDTRHPEVAAKGLALGVSVLNDVTGFSDPGMLELATSSACGLIAMRSRLQGGFLWMPDYANPAPRSADQVVAEVRSVKDRLLGAGIAPDRILLDPGFGFGTTYLEDLALWKGLPGLPAKLLWKSGRICLGLSRKRFLAWRGGDPRVPPAARDALTAAAHREAQAWGYRVFRTHAIP